MLDDSITRLSFGDPQSPTFLRVTRDARGITVMCTNSRTVSGFEMDPATARKLATLIWQELDSPVLGMRGMESAGEILPDL